MIKGSRALASTTCKQLLQTTPPPQPWIGCQPGRVRSASISNAQSPGGQRAAPSQRLFTTRVQPKHILEDYQISRGSGDVQVSLDGELHCLDATWLRENCACRKCFNYVTHQRSVLVHSADVSSQVESSTRSTNCLDVKWADGHVSRYDLHWLHRQLNSDKKAKVQKRPWDGATLKQHFPRPLNYDDLVCDHDDATRRSSAIYDLLRNLLEFGFAFVDGVPADVEGTRAAVESFSPVQRGMFGDMWSFAADGARADTAYNNEALGVHTDNTYLAAPAGLQVFHCVHNEGVEGGDTILVDGLLAAQELSSEDRRQLCETRVQHAYYEAGYHMIATAPVLQCDDQGEMNMIRYNVYDRRVSAAASSAFYPSASRLAAHLERPSSQYRVRLTPGRMVVVDNWRVLHGRLAFKGDRRFTGCYVSRDDWMSAARSRGLLSDAE